MPQRLIPQTFTCYRQGYTRRDFANDLVAGLVTGVVALPLAIAFGIASGVTPGQGLTTAILSGFLISFLSGSRVQIGGPTGAFLVIVYGIVQEHGAGGLALATCMAGVLLVLMGVCRLGAVIKYLPYPLIIGFTAGIAVLIAVTQIPPLLGLQIENLPSGFPGKLAAIGRNLGRTDPASAGVGGFTLLVLLLWPRVTRRVPASLVAMVSATGLVAWLGLPVETVGSRFGGVPDHLPSLVLPEFSLDRAARLFEPAMTIALLAAIESLLSAVVADGMTGQKHRSNMELVAQGVANLVTPFFGGIPATGAIARTATSIKSGGTTPLAGMVHSLTLLLIVLSVGPYAARIPMSALAAILLVVAYNMSEWHFFVKLFHSPRSDVLVLLAVFLLTVFADLTVAIRTGVVLSALLFMRRMETVTRAGLLRPEEEEEEPGAGRDRGGIPEGVELFEINGPFFFGAAGKFQDEMAKLKMPRVLVLILRDVPAIDATGLHALEGVCRAAQRDGTVLLLAGITKQPASAMKKAGLIDRIGHANIHKDVRQAVAHARSLLGERAG